jgi:hypothetical protein
MSNFRAEFLARSSLSRFPIVESVRNGLIFQKSNRKRVAVFQTVPVHDVNGLAIDTALIEESGRYRGQGVNGLLYPNGEVHFSGKNLKQKTIGIGVLNITTKVYTELKKFPNGISNNQRLIREAGVYQYQEMLTEKGVKSQVVIASQPQLSEDFLVLETEVLDIGGAFPPEGEMTMPYATADGLILHIGEAWDSNGNRVMLRAWVVYLANPNKVRVYYGVPVGWADLASYPITIDPTITEQPDASAGKDTRIEQYATNTNYGSIMMFFVGESNNASNSIARSLIQFDISSIPADSVVTVANLNLFHGDRKASNACTMSIYRLKRDWVEAQATWNQAKSGTNWSTSGAANTTNDRESTVQGTLSLAADEANEIKTIPMGISGVQDWVSGTTPNYGWLLKTDVEANDGHRFFSSDYSVATDRPSLEVTYLYNPEPTRLNLGGQLISPGIGLYDTRIKLRAQSRDVRLSTGVRKQW